MAQTTCINCGNTFELRAPGWSVTANCPACNCVLNVTTEPVTVLQLPLTREPDEEESRPATIALGTSLHLEGNDWRVVGHVLYGVRLGANFFGGGKQHFWREYVLMNDLGACRWLVEGNGVWLWLRPVHHEEDRLILQKLNINWCERHYARALQHTAIIYQIAGEFHWTVKRMEEMLVAAFVRPHETLRFYSSINRLTLLRGSILPADASQRGLPQAAAYPSGGVYDAIAAMTQQAKWESLVEQSREWQYGSAASYISDVPEAFEKPVPVPHTFIRANDPAGESLSWQRKVDP